MSQGGSSGGGGSGEAVDTSALEEKNRQRLKDLEDAMRSTWEAKSKMSEEHERDRQALLIEQQNAARQFEAARQRNWALLEQKGDLEITLSHVKSLVTDRLVHSTVSGLLSQWTEALREVAVLERKLAEQDTVVQVYRNSLEKDSQALLQVRGWKVTFVLSLLIPCNCSFSTANCPTETHRGYCRLRQHNSEHAAPIA